MADATDLKSVVVTHAGSTPVSRTILILLRGEYMNWIKSISPKEMKDKLGLGRDESWYWNMDRCWIDKDTGICVSSRLIRVPKEFGGKIEHVTITKGVSDDGSGDISWAMKQQIKDELFGKNRLAIEVFPKSDRLVDVCDVYHLWVFDRKFSLPFGIHPKEYQKAVNRGYNVSQEDLQELKEYYESNNVQSGDQINFLKNI